MICKTATLRIHTHMLVISCHVVQYIRICIRIVCGHKMKSMQIDQCTYMSGAWPSDVTPKVQNAHHATCRVKPITTTQTK